MISRLGARCRVLGMVCIGLLTICAMAADRPARFRVTSIEFSSIGRLDQDILQECNVARVVTDAFQGYRTPDSGDHRAKSSNTTDLVLRIDRVARVTGRPPPHPDPGGTDLGISLLSAGSEQMSQPFLCRADGFTSVTHGSHCARVAYCGEKIAGQISTWLSWKLRDQ
jgi:hypothetical protein